MTIRFKFQEVLAETQAFASIAGKFTADGARKVLLDFHRSLETYRNTDTEDPYFWEIATTSPLVTIESHAYDRKKAKHTVIAEITATWEIQRESPGKKSRPAEFFFLTGIASTMVRLRDINTDGKKSDLAMWRVEIADSKSPGCYFHSQVLGEVDDPPFPKSLCVPRLPTILLTPAAVAEYAYSEIFQDGWQKHLTSQTSELQIWSPIQIRRYQRLLKWKLDCLSASSGSPWVNLKIAQPDADIFV